MLQLFYVFYAKVMSSLPTEYLSQPAIQYRLCAIQSSTITADRTASELSPSEAHRCQSFYASLQYYRRPAPREVSQLLSL
jgi:hypothetical protein